MSAHTTPEPEDVHPEYDRPTPSNRDEWSDDQLEEWQEAQSARLAAEEESQASELDADQQAALDALSADVEEAPTETVTVGGGEVEIEVTTKISGELEERLDTINKNREDLASIRDCLIDTILLLIVDDQETGPFDFQSREVWEAHYREHGTEALADAFETLVDPALERREQLGNWQDTRRGRTS